VATTCSPRRHLASRHRPSAKLGLLRRGPLTAARSEAGHRVTTLELFFDLSYVFAIAQVSALMVAGHDVVGVVRGATVLALLWWSWASYSWLGNHARADSGWIRAILLVGMTAVLVAGVVIHDSFAGGPDRFAPVAFVGAYAAARLAHVAAYALGSFEHEGLRLRVAAVSSIAVVPALGLLLAGALLGSPWQLPCWLAAACYEPFAAWVRARGVDWRVHSAAHVAERHGLIVILALGEAVVAIGSGVSSEQVTPVILGGSVLGILVSVAMWWTYFSRLAGLAEERLVGEDGAAQARLVNTGYTVVHLLLVAGILLTAVGVEHAMAHIGSTGPFGTFGAVLLASGLAVFLVGTGAFARVVVGAWWPARLLGAMLLLGLVTVVASVPPVVALGLVVGALVALIVVEELAPTATTPPTEAMSGSWGAADVREGPARGAVPVGAGPRPGWGWSRTGDGIRG